MNPQHKFQRRDSGDWPVCEVCDLPFTADVHRTEPTTTELSTEEAAVVQRFEAAADAEEALRERVARAMAQTGYESVIDEDRWQYAFREDERDDFRIYADAAIAVLRGES